MEVNTKRTPLVVDFEQEMNDDDELRLSKELKDRIVQKLKDRMSQLEHIL